MNLFTRHRGIQLMRKLDAYIHLIRALRPAESRRDVLLGTSLIYGGLQRRQLLLDHAAIHVELVSAIDFLDLSNLCNLLSAWPVSC